MKIAVSGVTGFVGGHVYERLRRKGHDIIPLTRAPSGLPDELVVGDLDRARITRPMLEGIDAVLHLAARTHVLHDTASDPLAVYRAANVAGTRTLLQAALAVGVKRFVFMSSIKAVAERSVPGTPIVPGTDPHPEDAYGLTKLEAENDVRSLCEAAGTEWTIIRPPLVYGPGVQANLDRLISLVKKGLPLPLGAIHNRRSMIYVGNLADAAVRACDAPGAANRILMIADATLSTPDLLHHIANALGISLRLFPVPASLLAVGGGLVGLRGEAERLCGSLEIDAESSLSALEWKPPYPFDEAMRDTVRTRSSRVP